MPTYTTLAVDLDGPALRNDKSLSPRTVRTLVGAQEQGMRLIIASGRPPQGIAHVADALQLARFGGYVLAYNGGELWQPQHLVQLDNLTLRERSISMSGSNGNTNRPALGGVASGCQGWRLIDRHVLPLEARDIAYTMGKEAGMELLTYHQGFLISENLENTYVAGSLRANRLRPQPVDNFLEATRPLQLSKCMVVGEPAVLEKLERPLAMRLLNMATVFRSEPYYMEIVPRGIDKGRGLERLLAEMGETPDHLIACGDAPNDIPMLCYAALGVAMGNAQPAVKAAADIICGTNEEDGVAQIVEQYWAA